VGGREGGRESEKMHGMRVNGECESSLVGDSQILIGGSRAVRGRFERVCEGERHGKGRDLEKEGGEI